MDELSNRRPIKSRGAAWARGLAWLLAKVGVRPDDISAASLAFAGVGGALLLWSGGSWGRTRALELLGVGLCVQLRLICNLLDGMVAVEHGKASSSGPIWNELPDRFADVILLACAGYSAALGHTHGAVALGWIAAALALLTAYLRELGRGMGFEADFSGPMAKPQRMAVLTIAAVASAAEPAWGWHGQTLMVGLGVIAVGTAVTAARRTLRLAKNLAARQKAGDAP